VFSNVAIERGAGTKHVRVSNVAPRLRAACCGVQIPVEATLFPSPKRPERLGIRSASYVVGAVVHYRV